MIAEITTKISGPPGTGKTFTLLNVVERLLASGTEPDNIAFTTYTRAGAYEARDRACAKFNLSPGRFPYFRTLHSLCYQFLPSIDIMGTKDWFALARILGVGFSAMSRSEEPQYMSKTKGDHMLALFHVAENRCQSYADAYKLKGPPTSVVDNFTWQEFEHFAGTVTNYKRELGKKDFTDILKLWIEEGVDSYVENVIIDEAQDLTPLMWRVAHKLCRNAKKVWIAGDDDQCIHEWGGAEPKLFIDLPAANYSVLPQSNRIPKKVHLLAGIIIEQVKNRLEKKYEPRNEEGEVQRIATLDGLDMSKGSWMLLARNQYHLDIYKEHCLRNGLWYMMTNKREGRMSVNAAEIQETVIHSVHSWIRLQNGEKVEVSLLKQMYKLMSRRDRVTNGFKQVLEAVPDGTLLTYDELVEKYGMVTRKDMSWYEALNQIIDQDRQYLRVIEQKGNLHSEPNILIATIHSVKGKEADNVVILPDMSVATYDGWMKNPDNEHRVFYVGVTRARKALYILPPSTDKFYPL